MTSTAAQARANGIAAALDRIRIRHAEDRSEWVNWDLHKRHADALDEAYIFANDDSVTIIHPTNVDGDVTAAIDNGTEAIDNGDGWIMTSSANGMAVTVYYFPGTPTLARMREVDARW